MMIYRRTTKLVLLCFIFIIQQLGWTLSCKVLISEGSNYKKSQNDSHVLKYGHKIDDKDSILIAKNGYLALVHVSGQVIELKPGKYLCEKIWRKFNNESLNIDSLLIGSYFMVPMPPLQKHVERCFTNHFFVYNLSNSSLIKMFPGRNKIEWINHDRKNNREQFSVMNLFDEVLFDTIISTQEYVILDFSKKEYLSETYGLKISLSHIEKGYASMERTEMGIKLLDNMGAEKALFEERSKMLEFYKNTKSSAIENYVLAVYFHQRKLMWDAYQYYQKACFLNPTVNVFKVRLGLFTDLDTVYLAK